MRGISIKLFIMQDFYVYILLCSDGSFYTGHTDDIEKRISMPELRHFPDCYAAKRLPVTVVHVETFASRGEALEAERKIKKMSRAKKQAIIDQDFDLLKELTISGIRRRRGL